MSGYYGGYRYNEITKGDIGANPGGKSGCDGCNLPLYFYSYGYGNSYSLAYIVLTAIALLLVLVSFGGVPIYRKWAAQVSTGLTRYGFKTFVLALAAIALNLILSIAANASSNTDRRVTRSFYLIYWFMQFFDYVGLTLLLLTITRFIRGQAAHAGRSIIQIVAFSLLAAAAIANLAAYIAYTAWDINIPVYDNYDYSSTTTYAADVVRYIGYLGYVWYITDLVYWAIYILTATYTTVTFFLNVRAFKIFGVLTTLLAIGLLVLAAVLNLAGDAIYIWLYKHPLSSYGYSSYNNSAYTTRQNLYLYIQIAPAVENILYAAACPVFVIAAYFASRHRVATTEKA